MGCGSSSTANTRVTSSRPSRENNADTATLLKPEANADSENIEDDSTQLHANYSKTNSVGKEHSEDKDTSPLLENEVTTNSGEYEHSENINADCNQLLGNNAKTDPHQKEYPEDKDTIPLLGNETTTDTTENLLSHDDHTITESETQKTAPGEVKVSPTRRAKVEYLGNPDEFELFVTDTWDRAMETLEIPKGQENPNKNLVVRRSGWKTIRIFVSSTFRDFHQEREVLVKKVRNESLIIESF